MDDADELLRRALLDDHESSAVALRVGPLSLAEALTIIFHGRLDLGTIQTYVTLGARGAGSSIAPQDLLRVPCDLDLADAADREDAEALYARQAGVMRDALMAADTVLAVWREPLEQVAGSTVQLATQVDLGVPLPAHRLMPLALTAPDRQLTVTAVCGARTLARGRPPLGIACAQPDLARVYPLPDDPARCLEDFLEFASEHAHELAEQLEHQEASVRRFLELGEDDGA